MARAENYVFPTRRWTSWWTRRWSTIPSLNHRSRTPVDLINNPWGESNEKGLKAALAAKNIPYAGIEKFETNDVDVVPQLARLKEAGADVLYWSPTWRPLEVVKPLDRMGWAVPIVSHWGLAGGRFSELAGASAAKVHFIQTYSFSGKLSPKGEAVLAALQKKYPEIKTLADVTPRLASPILRRHAPDRAGDRQGRRTRGAKGARSFYAIGRPDGLIKIYQNRSAPRTRMRCRRRLHLYALR